MSDWKTAVPGPVRGKGRVRRNVIQTLLSRELGFPMSSRSNDSMSNGVNERAICRQLMDARLPVAPFSNLQIREVNLDKSTNEEDEPCTEPKCRMPQAWFTLKTNTRSKVRYVGGFLWKTASVVNENRQKIVSNRFYKVEADYHVGLKSFEGSPSQERLKEYEVLSIRALTNTNLNMPTRLLVLCENGILASTILSSVKKLRDTDILPLNPISEKNLSFTDMSVDHENEILYVIASFRGFTKRLYIIHFPSLRINMIIHVIVNIKIQLWGSIVLIHDAHHSHFTSISSLIELSEELLPADSIIEDVECQRKLCTKPACKISIPTQNAFFGVLESTWPPLFFAQTKTGLIVQGFQDSTPIWSCELNSYTHILFDPMPDQSNAVLFTKDNDQYVLTWTKKTDYPPTYEVEGRRYFQMGSSPFASSRSSSRPRLQRTCKSSFTNYNGELNTKVLGMDYFDGLDLIAVCVSFEEALIVSLFEPRSFKFFVALPPLQVACSKKSKDSHGSDSDDEEQTFSKIDNINKIVLEFDYEIIFMTICYDSGEPEWLVMRLLEEKLHEN